MTTMLAITFHVIHHGTQHAVDERMSSFALRRICGIEIMHLDQLSILELSSHMIPQETVVPFREIEQLICVVQRYQPLIER